MHACMRSMYHMHGMDDVELEAPWLLGRGSCGWSRSDGMVWLEVQTVPDLGVVTGV